MGSPQPRGHGNAPEVAIPCLHVRRHTPPAVLLTWLVTKNMYVDTVCMQKHVCAFLMYLKQS